jgi:hypothetical protein
MQNLNPELWMVFLPAISAMLFALGGTQISATIPGKKWIRRFVLPIILGICVYFAGFGLIRAIVTTLISSIAFIQGYGERASWAKRVLIFSSYGMISLAFGVSWWNLICVGGCIVLFLLSNWKLTAKTFAWKVCESSMGFFVGMQVAFLLSGNGKIF